MAKYVTRTFETTNATVLCMDTERCEACNVTVALRGKFKDDAAIMKAVKKTDLGENIVPCQIVNVDVEEHLYAVTEEEFLAIAKIHDKVKED